MDKIWIQYQNKLSKEFRIQKFWYAEEAKKFVDYLRKNSKSFLIVACGGFEDEDEKRYVLGE